MRAENAGGFVVSMELRERRIDEMAEGERVLIVEDDGDVSMIEEAYLEAAGFHPEILSDGKAGCRAG